MNLTLEQLLVLTNTPEWFVSKSEIMEGVKEMKAMPINFLIVHNIVEQLIVCRYIQKHTGQYRITPEGITAMKEAFTDLKDLSNGIGRMIAARS